MFRPPSSSGSGNVPLLINEFTKFSMSPPASENVLGSVGGPGDVTTMEPRNGLRRMPYCRSPDINGPVRRLCTALMMFPVEGEVEGWFQAEPQKMSCTGAPVAIAPLWNESDVPVPGLLGKIKSRGASDVCGSIMTESSGRSATPTGPSTPLDRSGAFNGDDRATCCSSGMSGILGYLSLNSSLF